MAKHAGEIHLIMGCMFAGKTTELMARVERVQYTERPYIILRPKRDTRSLRDSIETHKKNSMDAVVVGRLMDAYEQASSVDYVFIDEGQFCPDLEPFCDSMARCGKIVHVAMLDGTFDRKPFKGTENMGSICDTYTKVHAVCMHCKKKDATFTKRIGESKKEVIPGGKDMYMAVCRTCYYA